MPYKPQFKSDYYKKTSHTYFETEVEHLAERSIRNLVLGATSLLYLLVQDTCLA